MRIRPEKILNENIFFWYAIYLLSLIFFPFIIACLGFFVGLEISVLYFPLSMLLSSVLFFYHTRKLVKISVAVGHLVVINLFLAVFFFICINVFDTSYDGLWYHQPAIIKLAGGWNPVKNPFYATTQYDACNYLWIQHYPKAAWIMAACIYKMTGLVESGKMINFIVVTCVFFYSYVVFSKLFKGRLFYILAFSLLISLNPVSTSQLLSDYVDGILSGMLSLIFLSLLNMQWQNDRYKKWNWFILCGSIIMITNLKFTGLFMAAIIIIVFSAYWWWKRERIRLIFKKYILIGAVSVTSFFVFGFNPYYTNLHYKSYVFYPLNKEKSYAVLKENEPVILRGRSNTFKFFISIFSESDNNIQSREIRWKNPLVISKNELRAFAGNDVRIGGMGPLFLLAFLLSIPAFLFVFNKMDKDRRVPLCIAIGAIFLSVIFVPMAWWARYTPQFYLLPVLLLIFPVYMATSQKNIFNKYFPACIVIVLFMNLVLIAAPNFAANRIKTRLVNQEMNVLKLRKAPLLINFSKTEFQALRTRLKEAGISFSDSDTLKTNIRELRSIYNLYGYGPVYNIGD